MTRRKKELRELPLKIIVRCLIDLVDKVGQKSEIDPLDDSPFTARQLGREILRRNKIK